MNIIINRYLPIYLKMLECFDGLFMNRYFKKKEVMFGPANNTGDPSHDDEAAWSSCFDHGWPRAGGS